MRTGSTDIYSSCIILLIVWNILTFILCAAFSDLATKPDRNFGIEKVAVTFLKVGVSSTSQDKKKKSNSLHLLHHIDNGWVTRLLNMIDYRQYLEHASGLCKLGSVVIIIQINGVMLKQHQLPTCSLHLNTSSFLYTHSLLKVFQLRAAGFAPPLWSASAACSRVIEGSRKEFGERSDASVLRWSSDRPATAVNVRLKSLVSHATIRHANHQSVRGACLVYSR